MGADVDDVNTFQDLWYIVCQTYVESVLGVYAGEGHMAEYCERTCRRGLLISSDEGKCFAPRLRSNGTSTQFAIDEPRELKESVHVNVHGWSCD